jgi:hypothetical protein
MSSNERVLYFREAPHDTYLVFAPPDRALYVDKIHRAIEESMTWGEFRKRLPAGEYQKLYEDRFSDDPDILEESEDAREPADDEPFSAEYLPGYSDGDYPPWVAPEQGRYLPREVLKEFATRGNTSVNGSFWRLDTDQATSIVERLTNLGYKVERRDDLKFW